jgi:hypothetical protein
MWVCGRFREEIGETLETCPRVNRYND